MSADKEILYNVRFRLRKENLELREIIDMCGLHSYDMHDIFIIVNDDADNPRYMLSKLVNDHGYDDTMSAKLSWHVEIELYGLTEEEYAKLLFMAGSEIMVLATNRYNNRSIHGHSFRHEYV
jgi:hypothetical protein